jgi:methyl-accepting chemotaxis protein
VTRLPRAFQERVMTRVLQFFQGFRRPTLSRKLAMLAGLALAGVLLVGGAALWNLNHQLLDSAQQRTRAIVDAAYGIVTAYEAEERAGRMPREEAQRRALSALNAMRYGDGDYVFVVNPEYTTVGHPNPQMIGRSMRDARDPNGRYFAREIVETAQRNGQGVTRYMFPKAGSDQPVEKVSFARYFTPWTWTIGSGVYLDDVAAAMRGELLRLGGVALAVAFVVLILTVLLARSIGRPVRGLTQSMTALAGGDHGVAIPHLGRHDEIGAMAGAVQVFKDNAQRVHDMEREAAEQKQHAESERRATMAKMADAFGRSVGEVVEAIGAAASEMQKSAESLTRTAADTSRQSSTVATASEQATSNAQTVAAASEELSSSIAEISRQVSSSARMAAQAVGEADKTNEQVQSLAAAAQKIGDVVKLINDIAGQTNLLALNATIEAARAGEAGKGFAVVASEVKSLANQTAKATEEIAAQIAGVQNATESVVGAIKAIGGTIEQINGVSTSIASAVEEQGAATQEIARNVQQAAAGTTEVSSNIAAVSQAAQHTGTAASQVLDASHKLGRQAQTMRAKVDEFLAAIKAA